MILINQILDNFKAYFSSRNLDIDSEISDNYIPKEGTYIIVEPNNKGVLEITTKDEIKFDKKLGDIDRTIEKISLICKMDYYSNLMDMNKPVDSAKIIHSNNYISFFIKKENLSSGKLTDKIIENYFENLRNWKSRGIGKVKTKDARAAVSDMCDELESSLGDIDLEKLEMTKTWIFENLKNLDINTDSKNYLKIFFLFDIDLFEKEGNRYMLLNLYNSNDYMVDINGEKLGLPNYNMGMNAKKPYLENKTRKTKIPFMLNLEDALYQKKIFDLLDIYANKRKYNIYIDDEVKALADNEIIDRDFSGIYLRIQKGKETEIHDVDIISDYSPNLERFFKLENYLHVELSQYLKNDNDNILKYNKNIKTKSDFERMINKILFDNYLLTNYFSDDISIKGNDNLKKQLLINRRKLFNWFHKGESEDIWTNLKRISEQSLIATLSKEQRFKAVHQYNLKCSMEKYFKGGENMADSAIEIRDSLKQKINNRFEKDNYIAMENDREYYYGVGQLTSYFLSKSKSKKKNMSFVNQIISCKKDEIIKMRLGRLFKQYNYDMDYYRDYKIRNLYSMINAYVPESGTNVDMIINGFLSSNLVYEKREEQENE